MPAKAQTSLRALENPSQNLANSTPSVHFSLHFTLRSPLSFPVTFHALLLPTFPILLVFARRFTPVSSVTLTLLWTPPSLQRPLQFPLHASSLSASLTNSLCNALSTPLSSLYSTLHCFSTSLSTSFHCTFPSHLSLPLHISTTGSHATKTRPGTSMAN